MQTRNTDRTERDRTEVRLPGGRTDRRPLDTVFDALTHPVRREIVTVLLESNARSEGEFPIREFEHDEPDHHPTQLYHTHVPKLEAAGYVEWNRGTSTIRPGPRFDEIAPFVELLIARQHELPSGWP